ncbi:hypothetical protein BpHYR1_051470 [Brachionus plicatilis]|uniref:Uncharacterized protein n=1 Tax=Brachionus plicatilis TaxID=10195 RepID=A0A3M7QBG5_BRAPC|nr:hypothetical protein BpHYR1_051470 [Brachionus plicatilis]
MSLDQENTLSEEVLLENEIDDTQDDEEEIVVKNKRGKGKVYDFYNDYDTFEIFQQEMKSKNIGDTLWNYTGLKSNKNEDKYCYDCNCQKNGCKISMYYKITDKKENGSAFMESTLVMMSKWNKQMFQMK